MSILNSKYIFTSIVKEIYQRQTYPHIVKIIPFNKCLKDLDLLAASITYSITTNYYDRNEYYWPFIRRALCNGESSKLIYISLVFNKPTSLQHLRVTCIKDIKDISVFPSLRDRVLSDLNNIIRKD